VPGPRSPKIEILILNGSVVTAEPVLFGPFLASCARPLSKITNNYSLKHPISLMT
jgi:hypothetical protein